MTYLGSSQFGTWLENMVTGWDALFGNAGTPPLDPGVTDAANKAANRLNWQKSEADADRTKQIIYGAVILTGVGVVAWTLRRKRKAN